MLQCLLESEKTLGKRLGRKMGWFYPSSVNSRRIIRLKRRIESDELFVQMEHRSVFTSTWIICLRRIICPRRIVRLLCENGNCGAKSRRCESSRVASPRVVFVIFGLQIPCFDRTKYWSTDGCTRWSHWQTKRSSLTSEQVVSSWSVSLDFFTFLRFWAECLRRYQDVSPEDRFAR